MIWNVSRYSVYRLIGYTLILREWRTDIQAKFIGFVRMLIILSIILLLTGLLLLLFELLEKRLRRPPNHVLVEGFGIDTKHFGKSKDALSFIVREIETKRWL